MKEIKYEKISDDINVAQDARGLILTTDACLLSAFVSKNAKHTACELGAGSGIISLMLLSQQKIKSAVCVDFQPDICAVAEENAKNGGFAGKMSVVCSDVLDYRPDVRFDCVVCNPPYFRANDGRMNKSEQDRLTRHESTATVGDFAACASRILKDAGAAYFCYTPTRLPELLCAMSVSGIEPKTLVTVYPTAHSEPSLVLVSGKKGAAPGMRFERPLIIYENGPGGPYSEDYIRITTENRIEL